MPRKLVLTNIAQAIKNSGVATVPGLAIKGAVSNSASQLQRDLPPTQ